MGKSFLCCRHSSKSAAGIVGVAAAVAATIVGAAVERAQPSTNSTAAPSSVTFLDARSRDRLVDLRGDWRFATGDDMSRAAPDFDDSRWTDISVPDHWEDEGFRDYDGYAWYRRTFHFDGDESGRHLYLLLGRIDDVDEAFVNGQRVGGGGQFPPEFVTAWNFERVYALPFDLLKPGRDNVVAVRVYDRTMGGGIADGPVGIYASGLPRPLIDLGGIWRLRRGDDPSWREKHADETGFTPVVVPAYWDQQGFADHDGHAWYRKSFQLGSRPAEGTMIMLLGRIDDTDEVFLNGTRIGGTGALDESDRDSGIDYWNQPRRYEFAASLLEEYNVLAVRVYDVQQPGGIYAGPVGIMTQAHHETYAEMQDRNRRRVAKPIFDWLMGRQ